MKTRNILIGVAILIVIVVVALVLRNRGESPATATPTPTRTPLPTGTFDMGGALETVGSGSITIKGSDGVVTEIMTPSSTAYYDESSRIIARSSFQAGQWVSARVTRNSSGKLDATFVMKWYASGAAPVEGK